MVEVQSSGSNRHFSINCFPHDSLRQPVFTGPDGLYPHRSHRLVDRRPLGTNPYTREATWDADYLWRAPTTAPNPGPSHGLPFATYTESSLGAQPLPAKPHPATLGLLTSTVGVPVHLRPRSSFAGEIGWHQFAFRSLYPEAARTGHQILTSEFRRELEDRYTHRYQNPWYPSEGERPDPSREGAYFCRFPASGQRARTSHDDRRSNESPSHSATSRPSRDQPRAWRRTPAATPTTAGDTAGRSEDAEGSGGEVVSVEQSEDGDAGGGVAGNGVERGSSRYLYGRHAFKEPPSRSMSHSRPHTTLSGGSIHKQQQQRAQ